MTEPVWKIFIIDNDASVHDATDFALSDEIVCGRPLEFHHAFSALEAIKKMETLSDVAVILLDVVMETPNAGLDLVSHIRSHPNYEHSLIVIRTGQPGLAPEKQVMRQYLIDDYCPKAELTTDHLLTKITGSIRAYQHRLNLAQKAQGLEKILESTSDLIKIQSSRHFAEGVLHLLAKLLDVALSGLLIIQTQNSESQGHSTKASVLAGSGKYANKTGAAFEDLGSSLVDKFSFFFKFGKHQFTQGTITLIIPVDEKKQVMVYLEKDLAEDPWEVDEKHLSMFAANIGLSIKNLSLIEKLQHLVQVDEGTGLPSKTKLYEKIQALLDEHSGQVAVASVELSEWDLISTGISPEAADRALASLAKWVKKHLPRESLIARVGDNRLGITLKGSGVDFQKLLPKQGQGVSIPVDMTESRLPIRPKIGWSSRESSTDVAQIWREAALALDESKFRTREHFVRYRDDLSQMANERLKISRTLSQAIHSGKQLNIEYQPVINLLTGHMTGAEALCRWKLQDGTTISPKSFIPIAEATGQILSLGRWVLEKVCQLSSEWAFVWEKPPILAVNVSVQQLQWSGFVRDVQQIVDQTGVDPSQIELEITESRQMEDTQYIGEILSELKSMGFRIALDDFGTGFASLTHLLLLPLDTIKIDYMVTDGIDRSDRHLILAKAIIQLAHDAGLTVVAEGVERESQEKILKQLGCDRVQGYFYAKPDSVEKCEELLAKADQAPSMDALLSEDPHQSPTPATGQWEIMVIDNTSNVHDAIAFALEKKKIFGSPLSLIHEFSTKDALCYFKKNRLPAVIFLDLDIENSSAELNFLDEICQRSDYDQTQIVFFGAKNDHKAQTFLEGYDVYGFYNKNELSAYRLVEIITGALRARHKAFQRRHTVTVLKQHRRQLEILKARLAERMRTEADLRKELRADTLTGVASRALMEQELPEQWSQQIRSQTYLGFLIIDVDHFKKFNDSFGHLAGDQCLRRVAHAIKSSCLRTTDVCARYGGDEFAVIAPFTDPTGCEVLAEKILKAISEIQPGADKESPKQVTVSIGIASWRPTNDKSFLDLVEAADQALYKAKSEGRNRFVLAPSD